MGSRLVSLQLHLLKTGRLATLAASPPKRRGEWCSASWVHFLLLPLHFILWVIPGGQWTSGQRSGKKPNSGKRRADGPSQSQVYCCPSGSVILGAREGKKNSVLGTRLCVWEGAMGPCGG